jgi:ribokinase
MRERSPPRIVVLGSVHIDLIATAERLPARGESVTGGMFAMAPGGKAGNQACQLALAGAEVFVMTRLGDDIFGRQLLTALADKGVDTSLVAIDASAPTGASTVLAAEGDYSSIIAPGAADLLSREDVERARPVIESADALVAQLEIAPEISAHAAAIANVVGGHVILNASPAPGPWSALPATLRRAASHLVVNRVEAGRLLGHAMDPADSEAEVAALAEATGAATVVMTLGAEGSVALSGGAFARQPAFPTSVVDAVGAGDAFLGACVLALLEGEALGEALRRGAAAGCIAVARRGVYDALPSRDEIEAFLARQR